MHPYSLIGYLLNRMLLFALRIPVAVSSSGIVIFIQVKSFFEKLQNRICFRSIVNTFFKTQTRQPKFPKTQVGGFTIPALPNHRRIQLRQGLLNILTRHLMLYQTIVEIIIISLQVKMSMPTKVE